MYICVYMLLLLFLIYTNTVSGLGAAFKKRSNQRSTNSSDAIVFVFIKSPISLSTGGIKQKETVGVLMLQNAVQGRDTIFKQAGLRTGNLIFLFFPSCPWLPDCSVKSQSKCDRSKLKQVAQVLFWASSTSPAELPGGRLGGSKGVQAPTPALQSSQAAHPGMKKSRLL